MPDTDCSAAQPTILRTPIHHIPCRVDPATFSLCYIPVHIHVLEAAWGDTDTTAQLAFDETSACSSMYLLHVSRACVRARLMQLTLRRASAHEHASARTHVQRTNWPSRMPPSRSPCPRISSPRLQHEQARRCSQYLQLAVLRMPCSCDAVDYDIAHHLQHIHGEGFGKCL